jgi:hypothetical protein
MIYLMAYAEHEHEYRRVSCGIYCHDLGGVAIDGVWIGWLDLLYFYTQLVTTCIYSAIADLHTLQFTVTHTLGISVFTSRILATKFNSLVVTAHSKCHCTIAYMKSSIHNLISTNSLLSLLKHPAELNCTQHSTNSQLFPQLAWGLRYIASGPTPQKTPFVTNSSIVAHVFTVAGTCLPSRCLAMNIYSGSTIPAFRRHVTLCIYLY